ncbi:Gfo/Idh/MocA family protein [Paenibacillus alvei]|uniref:Gfo/Idh/MocA family protein n=1 Tax=Paenibacillus alvei TaxID=44250 RepID=UPI0013DA771F|nr:Gfo/Idh/MocA family oxidoreductase [Paenibacillus alvei]NEZ43594.1 gfo/Idh/MocA family oxidoreductase [Paenibacillus alvei]
MMIRVAVCSYWHVHAEEYTDFILHHPDTVLAAIWDENEMRGERYASRYQVPFYADLDHMLAQADIDAVVVVAPTRLHEKIMVKAAKAGKHIFTEKVLAPTLAEADRIVRTAEANNVVLTVALRKLYERDIITLRRIVGEGAVGNVSLVRVRMAHNGALAGWLPDHFYDRTDCGGGVMIDLGCHPMYITRVLQGMPRAVTASYGYVTGKEVEDNAVALLQYDGGAIGIAETGFVTGQSPFMVEIHGANGSIVYGMPDDQIRIRLNEGDGEWNIIPFDEPIPNMFEQWVDYVLRRETNPDNVNMALDLTKLIEAANQSAALGKSIPVNVM